MKHEEYKYTEITGEIIKCAFNVHNVIGNGFREVIYQKSLQREFSENGLKFVREFEMPIVYKGHQVGARRVDFLVENKVLIEIKALCELEIIHISQTINYLKVFNIEVGLLINFGSPRLQFKRLVRTNKK